MFFSPRTPSISRFLHTDSDLVMEARHLIMLLSVTILSGWVKGHYTGDNREYKHDLNEKVDHLAGTFNKNPDLIPSKMPCPIPNYAIQLIYKDSPVTTKLYRVMISALHHKGFIAYITKKCN